MPLVKTFNNKNYDILIWQITEDVSTLLEDIIKAGPFNLPKEISNKKRLRERIIAQLVINDTFPNYVQIKYADTGKPYLEGSKEYISIAHNDNYLAVLVSNTNCGIDIEEPSERILQLTPKFLTTQEELLIRNSADRKADTTAIWCAKEALYKIYGNKGLDFKEHLQIESISAKEIKGILKKEEINKSYTLLRLKLNNLLLVFGMD